MTATNIFYNFVGFKYSPPFINKTEKGSNHQELVSHPIPEHVDEFTSIVRIKLQHPFLGSYTQVVCESSFLLLVLDSAAIFYH